MENIEIKEKADRLKEKVKGDLKDWAEKAPEKLYLKNKEKGMLDAVQEKMVSRKLLVFITSTVLMWYGLDSQTWGLIAMTYIGGQSAIDFAKMWRHG